MKPLGKTIQIYCPTGEPRGVRIAEITTRIIQAVVVPRAKLEEALGRAELAGVGLYFLFGESESGGLPLAYIGEAEDCCVRFKQHNKNKDFWNIAVAIVSRTGSFTKAHGKLLEWLAIDKASKAGRYQLDNGNAGGEPNVPEWMQADVAEVFDGGSSPEHARLPDFRARRQSRHRRRRHFLLQTRRRRCSRSLQRGRLRCAEGVVGQARDDLVIPRHDRAKARGARRRRRADCRQGRLPI